MRQRILRNFFRKINIDLLKFKIEVYSYSITTCERESSRFDINFDLKTFNYNLVNDNVATLFDRIIIKINYSNQRFFSY